MSKDFELPVFWTEMDNKYFINKAHKFNISKIPKKGEGVHFFPRLAQQLCCFCLCSFQKQNQPCIRNINRLVSANITLWGSAIIKILYRLGKLSALLSSLNMVKWRFMLVLGCSFISKKDFFRPTKCKLKLNKAPIMNLLSLNRQKE